MQFPATLVLAAIAALPTSTVATPVNKVPSKANTAPYTFPSADHVTKGAGTVAVGDPAQLIHFFGVDGSLCRDNPLIHLTIVSNGSYRRRRSSVCQPMHHDCSEKWWKLG